MCYAHLAFIVDLRYILQETLFKNPRKKSNDNHKGSVLRTFGKGNLAIHKGDRNLKAKQF